MNQSAADLENKKFDRRLIIKAAAYGGITLASFSLLRNNKENPFEEVQKNFAAFEECRVAIGQIVTTFGKDKPLNPHDLLRLSSLFEECLSLGAVIKEMSKKELKLCSELSNFTVYGNCLEIVNKPLPTIKNYARLPVLAQSYDGLTKILGNPLSGAGAALDFLTFESNIDHISKLTEANVRVNKTCAEIGRIYGVKEPAAEGL